MKKQCANCTYATRKPPKSAACNNKVKLGDELVKMKHNGKGLPYCDAFKQIFKGK